MIGVGVLNALINVSVLVVTALIDRAVELTLRNLASNRLATDHHAPLIHDSDTWLPYLPRSVIKYHRYPAILLVVVLTILMVPAELVTELGIGVTSTCTPTAQIGPVIADGDVTDSFCTVELAGLAFFLQSTNFTDGPLNSVVAGVPRTITGTECISCLRDNPDIISGCSVSLERIYAPGELNVSVMTTSGPFETVVSSFNETDPGGASYSQRGDVTRNSLHWAAFMFHPKPNTSKDVLYLEYSDQQHIVELDEMAKPTLNQPASSPTRSKVHMYSISCPVNKINRDSFLHALMVYRTIQLENPVRPIPFLTEDEQFKKITPETVYRSVLGMKIVDDVHENGEFYRFTVCGKYNILFLIPIGVCVVLITLVGIASFCFRTDRGMHKIIPYSSRSWLAHVKRRQRQSGFNPSHAPHISIDSNEHEVILFEEGQLRLQVQTHSDKMGSVEEDYLSDENNSSSYSNS